MILPMDRFTRAGQTHAEVKGEVITILAMDHSMGKQVIVKQGRRYQKMNKKKRCVSCTQSPVDQCLSLSLICLPSQVVVTVPQESRLSSAGVAEANTTPSPCTGVAEANTTPSPCTKDREATQLQKAEQETHNDHLNSQLCTNEVTLPSPKDFAFYTEIDVLSSSLQARGRGYLQPLLQRFYSLEPSDSKLQESQYTRLVVRMEKLVAEVKELKSRFSVIALMSLRSTYT